MNTVLDNAQATRSWRDIPQPVKPRAMSRGGRWRLVMAGVRATLLVALIGTVAWSAYLVFSALREDPKRVPATAKAVPMKAPELETMRDGVLDRAWLARTLELPAGTTLLELDLGKLRDRILSDRQVITATLTRRFPDRLLVEITERMPIARLRVPLGDSPRDFLVARDGVIFEGHGFDPTLLKTLPWLDGLKVTPDGADFRPIPHMDVVARLLADAQFSAPHLYQSWFSVSLARLERDRELEVTTKSGTKALFTEKDTFFVQLARFDHIVESLARIPGAYASIDLTLGRDVPVKVERTPSAENRGPPAAALAPSYFPQISKTKREL